MTPFSIITVVLNNARGIRRTGSSLRNQSRPLYEWIVVDGGSTDGTLAVLDDYADLTDIVVSESDRGLYDAMNKGLSLATGEYVLFLNSDDVLLDKALDYVEQRIREQKEAKGFTFVIGGAVQRFPNGISRIRQPISFDQLWHRIPGSHQATFINRIEHLSVPHDISYKVSSDYYTVAKIYLSRKRPVLYISRTIVETPVGGASFTSRNFFTMLKDHCRVQRTVLGVALIPLAFSLARKVAIISVINLLSIVRSRKAA